MQHCKNFEYGTNYVYINSIVIFWYWNRRDDQWHAYGGFCIHTRSNGLEERQESLFLKIGKNIIFQKIEIFTTILLLVFLENGTIYLWCENIYGNIYSRLFIQNGRSQMIEICLSLDIRRFIFPFKYIFWWIKLIIIIFKMNFFLIWFDLIW